MITRAEDGKYKKISKTINEGRKEIEKSEMNMREEIREKNI